MSIGLHPKIGSFRPWILATLQDGSEYPVRALLSSKNAKLAKSNHADRGFFSTGLSVAPSNLSGFNVCPRASKGCSASCLFFAGQGRFDNVKRARIAKARALFQNRHGFLSMLRDEISREKTRANDKGLRLAVRLNVLSDLPWERIDPNLFADHSDVQFYDYTKVPGRIVPSNYYLTFSRSETNEQTALQEYARGFNLAVVFESADLPETWHGIPVFSGDQTDLRFLDPRGIVGLYVKGKAKTDRSGFVVRES